MTTSLDGLSVLVTGASGGLGAPLTRLLAEQGARLTLLARDASRVQALGVPGALALGLDLRDPAAAAAAVEAAVGHHGGLDGVVHAAGVVAFTAATDTDDAVLAALFDLNVLAPVRLLRAATPHLTAAAAAGRPAFVTHLSGVVAEQPVAGMAAYCASKAALAAFDAAAARELRRTKIRLIDARPPHTETGLATRPIAGQAPTLPEGKRPEDVALRILQAILNEERDLPAAAFA